MTNAVNLAAAANAIGGASGELRFNSGFGSVGTAYACRAWVNFDGTVANTPIRGDGGVSSVTDSAVGIYVVNLSPAMPDANYSAVIAQGSGSSGGGYVNLSQGAMNPGNFTINTRNSTPANADYLYVCAAVFR